MYGDVSCLMFYNSWATNWTHAKIVAGICWVVDFLYCGTYLLRLPYEWPFDICVVENCLFSSTCFRRFFIGSLDVESRMNQSWPHWNYSVLLFCWGFHGIYFLESQSFDWFLVLCFCILLSWGGSLYFICRFFGNDKPEGQKIKESEVWMCSFPFWLSIATF